MPREPKANVRTIQGPNGLVAAAVRLTGPGSKGGKIKNPPWYTQAWNYYDVIGEFRYACNWVGNLLSRATLEVWEDGKPTKDENALAAMASFFGGPEGQREFLRQSGTQLTVPGDYYILGEDMGDAPDRWRVISASRLKKVGDGDNAIWKLGKDELDNPLVIRLWRPHPNDETKSDSPTRAVLPILSEIDNMTKYVASQLSSRIASAGIFTVPNEMTFGSVRGNVTNGDATDSQNVNTGLNAFLIELYETISANLADPEDASARVPVLLSGPGDSLQHMRHITFATELDKQVKSLREEAIRRLALGMDMPPEVLTGSADLNHWNAWQVEEASIKAHTEPLLQIITSGLTEKYLWPYLLEADDTLDEDTVRKFTIHADTSKIRLRPNRSKEALELYDRGILSLEATARENGFDPADIMGDDERKTWQLRKVAGGSTTPELVAWALKALGLAVPDSALTAPEVTPTEAPSDRSLTDHPENAIPDPTQAEVDASEVAIFRALERAGAKLRSKYKTALVPGADTIANAHLYRYAHLSEEMYDDLLAGAWEICADLAISMSPAMMDAYVRHLFTSKEQFTTPGYRRFTSHTLVRVA